MKAFERIVRTAFGVALTGTCLIYTLAKPLPIVDDSKPFFYFLNLIFYLMQYTLWALPAYVLLELAILVLIATKPSMRDSFGTLKNHFFALGCVARLFVVSNIYVSTFY